MKKTLKHIMTILLISLRRLVIISQRWLSQTGLLWGNTSLYHCRTLSDWGRGRKEDRRRGAGLAKVSWAAPAQQWSFNWTPFVSKLNISVWAFKNPHKGGEREGKKRQKRSKTRKSILLNSLRSGCLVAVSYQSSEMTHGSLPPPEHRLLKTLLNGS